MALPHFVLLYVDEPQASAAFYARLLEPPAARFLAELRHVRTRAGPEARALGAPRTSSPRRAAQATPENWRWRSGPATEVEALCADWKRKGAAILQEPVTMDFGLTFLAADPDGHRLRVFCPALRAFWTSVPIESEQGGASL